ncbi:MAG: hypothetical protein WAK26_01770, partial [Terracidiphilus sp.]
LVAKEIVEGVYIGFSLEEKVIHALNRNRESEKKGTENRDSAPIKVCALISGVRNCQAGLADFST